LSAARRLPCRAAPDRPARALGERLAAPLQEPADARALRGALGQLEGAVHDFDVFRRQPGAEFADEPRVRPYAPGLAERELAQRRSVLVLHEHLTGAVAAGAVG